MATAPQTEIVGGKNAGDVKFCNVLVPTDFSQASLAALPQAAAIAQRFGSRVFVAHIFLPPIYPSIPAELAASVLREERDAAQQEMRDFLQRKEFQGMRPEAIFATGSPAATLLRIIREQKIDLVVIATHGRTGFRRILMGSVAEAVVRHAPCPVLMVPMPREKGDEALLEE